MSTSLRVQVVVAILLAFSSGALVGYLRMGRQALRMDARWRALIGALSPPLAGYFSACDWAARHPIRAMLLDAWMLTSLMAAAYVPVVVFLFLWSTR